MITNSGFHETVVSQ